MNENYQDRDEDRRTLARALRQAERDGALRAAEAMMDIALQYQHTDSLIGTMHELRARIQKGDLP